MRVGTHSVALMFFLLLFFGARALAVNISNPMNLIFVADRTENHIDVIDAREAKVVFRIETPFRADTLIATPYAPLLFFANIEAQVVVAYNLQEKKIDRTIQLAMVPRHVVLDTTGKYIGITDSKTGGIAVISAYARQIVFQDRNFPATADILFDPNEIDLYYTNNQSGSLGRLDINSGQTTEVNLVAGGNSRLSSPSRSLDGRYIYVAESNTGDVFSLNAFSGVVFKTFNIGASPARPYTSPEGVFLYLLDSKSGRFVSVEQNSFGEHSDTQLGRGVDLVTVGRFDRLNLLLSSSNNHFYIYDNIKKSVLKTGEFRAIPFDAQGSIDGKQAYVAFHDAPHIAVVDLENRTINYIPATKNGAGAFSAGATNNVCH